MQKGQLVDQAIARVVYFNEQKLEIRATALLFS
jgi:hypothetical protein